ncbi:MAG: hypothetical protein Q6K80_00095 [Thermostichus sp. DG_1_6_bins_120]
MTKQVGKLFPRLGISSIGAAVMALSLLTCAPLPSWASTGSPQQTLTAEQAHQHYRLALHFWGRQQGATLNETLYTQGAQIGERYCAARRRGTSHQDWISQTLETLAATPNLSLGQMQGIARFTGAAILAYAPYHCPDQDLPLNQGDVGLPDLKNSGVPTRTTP